MEEDGGAKNWPGVELGAEVESSSSSWRPNSSSSVRGLSLPFPVLSMKAIGGTSSETEADGSFRAGGVGGRNERAEESSAVMVGPFLGFGLGFAFAFGRGSSCVSVENAFKSVVAVDNLDLGFVFVLGSPTDGIWSTSLPLPFAFAFGLAFGNRDSSSSSSVVSSRMSRSSRGAATVGVVLEEVGNGGKYEICNEYYEY